MVLHSIIPGRQGPSIILLILCFSIKITMLQGVNIFLISHPGIIHLKGQIGPESSLSFMFDIELIRGQAPYLRLFGGNGVGTGRTEGKVNQECLVKSMAGLKKLAFEC